jgi:hypothetical protein
MVMKWSWGDLPPQELQHMASLLVQDLRNLEAGTLDMTMITMLAGLGGSGTSPQHCHQNLINQLPKPRLPSMKLLTIFLEHSVFGVTSAISGIIWPHEFFANLYHCHRDAFFKYMVPSKEILHKFWRSVQGGRALHLRVNRHVTYVLLGVRCGDFSNHVLRMCCLKNPLMSYSWSGLNVLLPCTPAQSGGAHFLSHPVRLIEGFADMFIPIAIHGDGFPCMGVGKSWGKVMDAWQWSSILCSAKSKQCVWLIFLVHQVLRSCVNGSMTLEDVFRAMAWSFNAIYEGEWPKENWNGDTLVYPKASMS